ncbi:MAG: polymer-forming cytoskeletal protein [Bacteroides sp.]|nr:polymer-forming cytoskeletal protein [Prevotella sp.]MCM1408196.1 polymer-forming cytoskeletal protein [Treponema brennaborense]MCM1469520.1 polymer-forming cytoskeletal protein [Bacteroides sp.]
MAHVNQQKPKNKTTLGAETQFSGVLSFTDNLVITGKFDGTIRATGSLYVAKDAVCNVDTLSVESAVICGQVTGNMTAVDFIEMKSGSRIIGDVTSSRLRIEQDVDFQGQVAMINDAEKIDLFEKSAADFKQTLLDSRRHVSDSEI